MRHKVKNYLLDGLEVLVALLHSWWWSGERAAPDLNLLSTKLLNGLQLV